MPQDDRSFVPNGATGAARPEVLGLYAATVPKAAENFRVPSAKDRGGGSVVNSKMSRNKC